MHALDALSTLKGPPVTQLLSRAARALRAQNKLVPVFVMQTVSKIRTYAFAGVGSCEDYDDGLWEDGL